MRFKDSKDLVESAKEVNCFICKKNKSRKKCRLIPIHVKGSKGFDDINTKVWVCKKHRCLNISQ